MMNVQVEKTGNESNSALIRRFSKRVQGSGVLPRVRSIRYNLRSESKVTKKKRALKSLARKTEYERLAKLGKAPVKEERR
jgi:ribosomal protein S21